MEGLLAVFWIIEIKVIVYLRKSGVYNRYCTQVVSREVFSCIFLHENHEFCRRQNQFIDFVCINCHCHEVRVYSNYLRIRGLHTIYARIENPPKSC